MNPTHVSAHGVQLVARFEGYRSHVYHDSVGVATVGFGETDPAIINRYRHSGIQIETARALLRKRLNNDYGAAVRRLVKVPLSQRQFDALVSFAYNVGTGALESSTLLRELNRKHYAKAANQFLAWDRAGGRRLEGLTRRRRAERRLFLRGSNLRTRLRAAGGKP